VENIEDRAIDSASPTSAAHARQYLDSDGALVDHPAVGSLILLYTTGRVSGETRRTPLRFFEVDDDLVVAASHRGADTHPDWYLNLIEEPAVWVRRDADLYRASASPVESTERDRLWEKVVVARAPQFADYQAATTRTIPLVRLIADGGPG
jgi:deazaflavin-dependent oxidoreductase (nitroreductase family)